MKPPTTKSVSAMNATRRPRSRNLFHFHRPETLHTWLQEEDTLRARMLQLPELDITSLRACQIDAIHGIEDITQAGQAPRTAANGHRLR